MLEEMINKDFMDKVELSQKIQIVKLEEELGHSLDTRQVDDKIGTAQRRIVIKKVKQGHNYKYADLPEVLGNVYEVFEDINLTVKQPPYQDASGQMGIKTIISDPVSGQWVSGLMPLSALKGNERNDCQAIGAIQTYWRRYSLLSLLGLDDEDDDAKKADGVKVETNIKPQPQKYDSSECINEKQLGLLKAKIALHPEEAKRLDGVNLTLIQKKEFNGILSLFPNN